MEKGVCVPNSEEEEQEKEEDDQYQHLFPTYSERSQQDMSAMVSALAQVIGATPNHNNNNNNNPFTLSQSTTSHQNITQQSQPTQHQGIYFAIFILFRYIFCHHIHIHIHVDALRSDY